MLKELILQNPITSLLLILVPAVGIVWKVLHALYVKPRDFRINSMEKDIDVLRNEVLRVERKSKIHESSNISKSSGDILVTAEDNSSSDLESVNLDARSVSGGLILDNLQALLNLWNEKELTDLQKKHIEESYTNQSVVWEVKIKSIGEVKGGKIYVSMVSPRAEFELDTAIAYFDESYKDALLLIKKGESVVVSGVIERFFLSPILKDCTLRRK